MLRRRFTVLLIGLLFFGLLVQDAFALKINPGETVCFSNNKCFQIEKIVGAGNTSTILAIADGRVLRVPLRQGPFNELGSYEDYNRYYAEGYEAIRKYGVHAIHVYLEESLPGEYIIVDHTPIQFSYEDYVNGKITLTETEQSKVDDAFVEFARSTWAFMILGDQFSDQIVYTGEKWILLDWARTHKIATHVHDGTIFSKSAAEYRAEQAQLKMGIYTVPEEKLPLPKRLRKRVLKAIEEERIEKGLPGKAKKSCLGLILGYFLSA